MSLWNEREEYDYFAAFARCAGFASAAAVYLNNIAAGFNPARLPAQVEAMHKIEHDADSEKHIIMGRLAHEFITPIEREDIAALSQGLDNVVDAVEDVARRMYMFNLSTLRHETIAFTALIVQCCSKLELMVKELHNFKKSKLIAPLLIDVNTLESEGDRLHAEALRRLFTEPSHTRTQLVWLTLFEAMEQCLDACETAADLIESVIMKNT